MSPTPRPSPSPETYCRCFGQGAPARYPPWLRWRQRPVLLGGPPLSLALAQVLSLRDTNSSEARALPGRGSLWGLEKASFLGV